MPDLLTSKQVQEWLLVDRTTVYRMLSDGRLKGTKIGHQWRFRREDVLALLSGDASDAFSRSLPPGPRPDQSSAAAPGTTSAAGDYIGEDPLPLECVQAVQDVFAEVAQVGAVTADPEGRPLTEISNACAFCRLVLSTPSGRRACMASWRKLAQDTEPRPRFVDCHAGLQYARGRIELDEGELSAVLIAGQFYDQRPGPEVEARRVEQLARMHGLDSVALAHAAAEIRVLDDRMQGQIGRWLERVAQTFEDIGRERAAFLDRLRSIAELSKV